MSMLEYSCPVCEAKFHIDGHNEPRWKDSTLCTAKGADGSCCNTIITLAGNLSEIRDIQHYDGKNVVAKLKHVLKPAKTKSDVLNHIKAVVEKDIALGKRTKKSTSMMLIPFENKDYYVFFNNRGRINRYGDREMVINRLELRSFVDEGEDPEKWLDWDDVKSDFTGSITKEEAALNKKFLIKKKPGLIESLTEEKLGLEKELAARDMSNLESTITDNMSRIRELTDNKIRLDRVNQLIESYKGYMLYKFIENGDTRFRLNNQHYWRMNERDGNYKKKFHAFYSAFDLNVSKGIDVFEELRQASEMDPRLADLMDVLEGTIGLLGKFVDDGTSYDQIIEKIKSEGLSDYIRMNSAIESKIESLMKNVNSERDKSDLDDIIRYGDALYRMLYDVCTRNLVPFNEIINKELADIGVEFETLQKTVDDFMSNVPKLKDELIVKEARVEEIKKYLAKPELIPELKEYAEWLWKNDLVYINERIAETKDKIDKIITDRKDYLSKKIKKYSNLSTGKIDSLSKKLDDSADIDSFFSKLNDYFNKRFGYEQVDYEVPAVVSSFYDEHAKSVDGDISLLTQKFKDELMSTLKSIGFKKNDKLNDFLDEKRARLIEMKLKHVTKKLLHNHLEKVQGTIGVGYTDKHLEGKLKSKLGSYYVQAHSDYFMGKLSKINEKIKTNEMRLLTADLEEIKEAKKRINDKSKKGLVDSDYKVYPSKPKKAEKSDITLVNFEKESRILLFFKRHQDENSINEAVDELMKLIADKVREKKLSFFNKLFKDKNGKVEGKRYELSIDVFGKPCYVDFVRKRVEGENVNFAKDILSLHGLLRVYESTPGKHSFKHFCETNRNKLDNIYAFSNKTIKKVIKKIRPKLNKNPDYIALSRKIAMNHASFVKKMGYLKGGAYAAVSTLLGSSAFTFVLRAMGANSDIVASTNDKQAILDDYVGMNSKSDLEARIKELDPQEDLNGNRVLDPGEDTNNNGVLDDYNASAANGNVAEASDAVKLYNAVFGTNVDFDRMCTDNSYAFHINNPTINEIALGYDVDGDSVLEASIPNPFYLNIGDPGSDYWSDNQQAGIGEHQDYDAAGGIRTDVDGIGTLDGLIQDASEALGFSVPMTVILFGLAAVIGGYGIYKGIKHLSSKRKDPVTVADRYTMYSTVHIADKHLKTQTPGIHRVSKASSTIDKHINLEFSLGEYISRTETVATT